MTDDECRDDADPTRALLSRRRMLRLAGTGMAGIAGCSGGEESRATTPGTDTPATATTGAPTATTARAGTPTATATDDPTATASETPTETTPALEEVTEASPDIVVAGDGSGDYETVGAAVDAIPETEDETRVYIKDGRYKEKLRIPDSKHNVTFVGESAEGTVLTYDDHADKPDPDGSGEIGTAQSASVFIHPPDFTARRITFENAAEPVAQAVALYSDGDRSLFVNCRFLGNQDTLLTHGEGKIEYYRDCYIEGDVDFIFGAKTSLFENCEIVCKPDGGYVTAPSTPRSADYGYVFRNCEVRAAEGTPDDSYYLGRPWRPYGRSVFMNTYLGDHIKPEGWIDSLSPEPAKETSFCAEYANRGPGYTPTQRVDWSHQLVDSSDAPAEMRPSFYTEGKILGDWNPRVSFGEREQLEVTAGETREVSVTLRNLNAEALTGVDLSLSAPEGWSVAPVTHTALDAIEPGDAPTVTWAVSAPADTRGAFTLTLGDESGEFEGTVSILVVSGGETAPMPYGINCGGASSVEIDGLDYVPLRDPADRAFVTATSGEFSYRQVDPTEIAGTEDDELYWSENFGTDLSFAVDVENGTYDVTLYFAELHFSSAGKRVFSVSVQGRQVYDHLDLAGVFGPGTALTRYVPGVEVTDGKLEVSTTSHEGDAVISGVRIVEA